MSLGEAFTILAVLEATDRMSKVIEKVDATLDGFTDTASKAAEAATAAGAKIDASLLQTASGTDALELASARAAAASDKATSAAAAQAEAEKALLAAQASVASEQELAAAATAVAEAQQRASVSAAKLASAQSALSVATKASSDEAELAAATAAVAEAQQRATVAATELVEAQARQAGLTTPEDVVASADALTASEKKAAQATAQATAAQERQAKVASAQASANDEAAAGAGTAADAQEKLAGANTQAAESSGIASKAFGIAGIAVAAVGYESVKAAGNFQSLTEHLVTDAGESQSQLKKVQAGILSISTATGTSTTELANGMYHIESAGYHGAAGLTVLQTAAEGAKVGGADLDTVSKALVGSMNAYNMTGSQSTSMMNQLIATVGAGDMKMEDLASSMSSVTAVAAAAKIPFDQVGGAIATMTAQGMSAQQATQDLGHTIGALSNPNAVQIKEMQAMGLSSAQVSKELGKGGLTGTFSMLTKAVAEHTKGGQVLISTFNSSAQAAANANTMIKAMPASLQKVASAYLNGSITQLQWTNDLKGMSPVQASMMRQFGTLADKTHAFSSELTSGSPAAQTYNAAMSKLMGGTTGLNTALMLTGGHTATFNQNVKTIGVAAQKGGTSVDNWSKIQDTFNQKMDRVKTSVQAAGIAIGTALLPTVTKIATLIVGIVGPMATWIAQHQKLVGLVLAVAGGMLAAAAGIKAVTLATKLWAAAQAVVNDVMAIFDAEADANPIGILVIAIAALVAGIIYAYTHFKSFRDAVQDVFHAIEAAAVYVWHAIDASIHQIVSAWDDVVGFFTGLWTDIKEIFDDAVSTVEGVIKGWYPLILGILSGGILLIPALIFKYWSKITGFISTAWGDAITFIKSVPGKIEAVFAGAASWLLKEGQDVINGLIDGAKAKFKDVTTTLSTAKSDVTGFFSNAETWLYNAGHAILEGLLSGLKSAWKDVTGFVSGIGSWISAHKGPISVDAVLLTPHGQAIMQGLLGGIKSQMPALESTLGGVTKTISGSFGQQYTTGITTKVAASIAAAQAAARPATSGGIGIAPSLTAIPGTGGAGSTIEIHNHFEGANIMSDGDMSKLADKVGNSVTKKLAASGVRIRA